MRPRNVILLFALCLAALAPAGARAFTLDPPHRDLNPADPCKACHITHHAPGMAITDIAGNPNLCMSCHTGGASAAGFPFDDTQQAKPDVSGTSHRWDSGASGWVQADAANSSTGTVTSSGAYTGMYAKTYTITMGSGSPPTTFTWSGGPAPAGGSGSGAPSGTVALDQGISVTFSGSFVAGNKWYVYVRPDIAQPTNPAMSVRTSGGKIMCSTCHNQHSQLLEPFGGGYPSYPANPPGTTPTPGGEGRHCGRLDNDFNQMCVECHGRRYVTWSGDGSHPVNVPFPTGAAYNTRPPTGTPTITRTPTVTPTRTDTPTGTWNSPTATRTGTVTQTPAATSTSTATRTGTVTRTPTLTRTPTPRNYRDNFDATVWTGTNGSVPWTAAWVENDPAGPNATSGNMRVLGADTNCPSGVGQCMRLTGANTTDNVYRLANMTGGTSGTLTFRYRKPVTGGTVRAEVSYDGGGTYPVFQDYTGVVSGTAGLPLSGVTATTRVRFRWTTASAGNNFYVDEVDFTY